MSATESKIGRSAFATGWRPTAQNARGGDAVLWPAILIASVVLGYGISVVSPQVAAAAVAGLLVVTAVTVEPRTRPLAIVGVLAIVAITRGAVASPVGSNALTRRSTDIVYLVGCALALANARRAPARVRPLAVIALMLLVSSETVGLVDSHASLFTAAGAAFLDLRWIGLLGWGILLARLVSEEDRVRYGVGLVVGFAVANIVVGVMQAATGRSEGSRLGIPIVQGIFGHPTHTAILGSVLVTFALADHIAKRPLLIPTRRATILALGVLEMFLSTRYKDFLAVGIVIAFAAGLGLARWRLAAAVAVAALPLLAIPVTFFADRQVSPIATQSVVTQTLSHSSTRAQLLNGAFELADANPPVGRGLGTYGSDVNESAEENTFLAVGLTNPSQFSGPRAGARDDNLIAHVIGERGFGGFALWLAALFAVGLLLIKWSPRHSFPFLVFVAAVTYMGSSPSYNAPTDAIIMFWPAVCVLPLVCGRASARHEPPRWVTMRGEGESSAV